MRGYGGNTSVGAANFACGNPMASPAGGLWRRLSCDCRRCSGTGQRWQLRLSDLAHITRIFKRRNGQRQQMVVLSIPMIGVIQADETTRLGTLLRPSTGQATTGSGHATLDA